jgi:hypothetical protein
LVDAMDLEDFTHGLIHLYTKVYIIFFFIHFMSLGILLFCGRVKVNP